MTVEVPDFTLAQLCWLLDLQKPRIGQLEEADIVVKTERDRYAAASVRNFVRFQRRDGGGSEKLQDAKLDLMTQKITMSKLDLDERRGKLVSIDHVYNTWGEIVRIVRQRFLALPTKLAPLLVGKHHAADTEHIVRCGVYEALEDLAENVDVRPPGKSVDPHAEA
jgi:hypothetical protein